jgi:ribose-phosphate pyrophosphokinase
MAKVLDLSEGFCPSGTTNGNFIEFERAEYPAGEVSVRLTSTNTRGHDCVVNTRLNSPKDIMELLMAVNALKEHGARAITVFIPYFPYSRQDRVCSTGEAFSLKVMCRMLEASEINEIITYDTHSEVASAMFAMKDTRFTSKSNLPEVGAMIEGLKLREKDLVLICPDQGAVRKTMSILQLLPIFKGAVYCNKIRKLTGAVEYAPLKEDLKGKTPIVIDDICDGGATFLALAEQLQICNSEQPYLFVSHGIFSKGIDELIEKYKAIVTTNSITNNMSTHNRLHVYPIKL